MFIEMMVTAVCIQTTIDRGGDGCPSALQAYYASHSEIAEALKRNERKIRSYPYANEAITYVILPTYTIIAAKRVKIGLNRSFSLNYRADDKAYFLEYSIPFL